MIEDASHRTFIAAMTQTFNMSELRQICYELGIDNEELPQADTKSGLVISLLKAVQRHGRFEQLVAACDRERPFLPWSELAANLPEQVAGLPADSPSMDINFGNVTNSQINIAGQNLNVQQPTPSEPEPDNE